MRRSIKICLAIITLYPLLYVISLFAFLVYAFWLILTRESSGVALQSWIWVFIPFHVVALVLIISLVIFYIINAPRNNLLAPNERTPWMKLISFGAAVPMPFYWNIH